MSPPAISLDSRPPSDPNCDFTNPNLSNFPQFQNGFSNSFSYSFNVNNSNNKPSSSRAGPRAKPRLVKQRRSCKKTPAFSGGGADNGVNPFWSAPSSNAHLNDNDVSFVFGFSSSNDRASDCYSSNKINDDQNPSFAFGVSSMNNRGSDCNSNNEDKDHNFSNNVNFVFGDSNTSNKGDDCNNTDVAGIVDSENKVCVKKEGISFNGGVGEFGSRDGIKKENGEVAGVAISFGNGSNGESGEEVGLSEELKKLKIEKNEKAGFNGDKEEGKGNVGEENGGERVFVFTSGGVSSDVPGGRFVSMVSEASGIRLNEDDKSVNEGETSGLGPRYANENVFVFGSSGNPASAGASIFQSPSFPSEGDGGSVKDVLQSLFSSSSSGAEVGNGIPDVCSVSEEKKGCNVASMTRSPVATFPEFKLPEFDSPLSFSSNFPSEFGKNGESRVRARALRDKHLRKTKTKAKHAKSTKQQPVEVPLSTKSVAQPQEANECYSPMDFSPYEETTGTNGVSHIAQEVSGQSKVELNNGLGATKSDSSSGSSENVEDHENNEAAAALNSDVANEGQDKFAFTASKSVQNHVSSPKRLLKKYRMKSASVVGTTSAAGGSSIRGIPNISSFTSMGKYEIKGHMEQGCESSLSSVEKACDKWRKRGNEAYEKGNLSEAEDLYTLGVKCIPPAGARDVVFMPIVRCYSNRAATRMALGRVREAVQDCLMAVKLDPTFHRAQMRAAECYLQLGELEDAMKCFSDIIESSNAVCLDRQVIIAASMGIRKSQKVIECTNRSSELLRLKTSEAAASALELIVEAMSMSIYSEKLLEMKAEALCMLQRHDEAIALCHQTRKFAEKNFLVTFSGDHETDDSSSNVHSWRQRALYKCHFHLGKLEMALEYIKNKDSGAKTQESSDPLAVIIAELLKEKSAGNTAFQCGKHLEAIEHYTTAILSSMESRPFAAICFCNRAAAHQALEHIADAISDCSLAIALDENYAKAVSRRATLHEMIRDYRQAAIDLQRLISILEKQSKQSGSGNGKELRQHRQRLSVMEEAAKRDTPLDLYLILGVQKSDPASEIKKAYRKAALRHHPDKAGQALVKGDVGDEGRDWKDIAELVHKDSERLFKMIGEAYAVLSDPKKREDYDEEEELRKALKERNNMRSTSRRHSEEYYPGYPFERSNNRRNWQDSYRTYTYSYRRH